MPTYQYRCQDCSSDLEVVQKFTDDALTDCPECDGSLRKVYSAVGVVFKGSGFYATDNRTKGSTASTTSAESKEPSADSGSAKPSGGEKKAADKPAAASKSTASPAA